MLGSFPRLEELYTPFATAFRTGDVALFDAQLSAGEKRLMERGTYLVVERAREGAVRGLMKKGWILEGKPARMAIDRFRWYFEHGAGMQVDSEEVECLVAIMIHKVSYIMLERGSHRLMRPYYTGPHQRLYFACASDGRLVQGQTISLVSHAVASESRHPLISAHLSQV